jgi:hypothetical protein
MTLQYFIILSLLHTLFYGCNLHWFVHQATIATEVPVAATDDDLANE